MTRRTVFSGALVAASVLMTAQGACAQSIVEQAAEHRFQLDFHVNDAALAKMLPPFRMGIGGKIGSGKQWMSWIALDDVVGALKFALTNETLSGPVNYVAPNPVTNSEFTKTLGKALSRPTLFPIPAFGVRLLFGELGEALLLGGQRVEPERLKSSGYQFQYSQLQTALSHALQKPTA